MDIVLYGKTKKMQELQELTELIELIMTTAKLMGYETNTTISSEWEIRKDSKAFLSFYLSLGSTLLIIVDEDKNRLNNDKHYNKIMGSKETHQNKLLHLQKILEVL